ncbi:MAG: hypothetical protein M1814_003410 [Vezdaea aestivalis]|nr:MAG: hypothetical protein M1814_003410 [Vezdaea aestivalis]
MQDLSSLFLIAITTGLVTASEPARPRGVGPEFAKFYKSAAKFQCISNPSVELELTQLNDDYCDCPDGSDEPGTSACAYLTPASTFSTPEDSNYNTTQALPGFYCKNKGHQPGYVSFTNVNDGVCDYEACCDGSDEWEGVGDVKCDNKCKEIGKEWRKKDEQRKKAMGSAQKRRKELILEAVKLKKELEEKVSISKVQLEAAEIRIRDSERELHEVEKREKGKVVKGPGPGGRVNVLAALARGRVEELRINLVDVRRQRNDAHAKISQLESILSTFKTEYNPNFNDEGVKRAVKGWEDYAAGQPPSQQEELAAQDRDLDEITKEDGEDHGISWAEWENNDEDDDVSVLFRFEEYLPMPIRDWIDQKLRDLRVVLIENGILADKRSSGESRAVSDARTALETARTDRDNFDRDLTSQKEELATEYGDDDIFRALKGKCIERDSGEYVYELCWLGSTTQRDKKTNSGTGMGTFVRFEKVMVDEELPADGKGLGSGLRTALVYENGHHCWNGPMRSTLVILGCAETDEVWKVVEAEKCVYRMEVGTPVMCVDDREGRRAQHGKYEL